MPLRHSRLRGAAISTGTSLYAWPWAGICRRAFLVESRRVLPLLRNPRRSHELSELQLRNLLILLAALTVRRVLAISPKNWHPTKRSALVSGVRQITAVYKAMGLVTTAARSTNNNIIEKPSQFCNPGVLWKSRAHI